MKKIIIGKSYLTIFVKNENNERKTIQVTISSDKTRMPYDAEHPYKIEPKFVSEITIAGEPDEIYTIEEAVLELGIVDANGIEFIKESEDAKYLRFNFEKIPYSRIGLFKEHNRTTEKGVIRVPEKIAVPYIWDGYEVWAEVSHVDLCFNKLSVKNIELDYKLKGKAVRKVIKNIVVKGQPKLNGGR